MFKYKENVFFCEQVSVVRIARRFGTPVFIYSAGAMRTRFTRYKQAFASVPHVICYAVKANASGAVLRELKRLGAGADVVSGGELFRALRAGIRPDRIVYAGVGKTDEEIRYALLSSILMINVESAEELARIDHIAGILKVEAPVAFRVNPDIDAHTHRHITTGKKENKFGVHFPRVLEHYLAARRYKHIRILGLHAHIGSQLLVLQPYAVMVKKLIEIVDALGVIGIELTFLNIGGGLGISYHHEEPPTPRGLARAVLPLIKGKGLTLLLEPGRSIVGEAGCLVTSVINRKYTGHKYFVVVDAAMNDLVRPAMYDAYHDIVPALKMGTKKKITADIVGPICETGDCFAYGRLIQLPERGDLLCINGAGAYGFSMSSQYNSRCRAAEVMVTGNTARLVRQRERYTDLVRGEV